MAVGIHQDQIARFDGEIHLLGLARFEADALKPYQVFLVGGNAAHFVAHVELHHFVAGALAGVLDVTGYMDRLAVSHCGRSDGEVGIFKGSIAQAVAERIEGTGCTGHATLGALAGGAVDL